MQPRRDAPGSRPGQPAEPGRPTQSGRPTAPQRPDATSRPDLLAQLAPAVVELLAALRGRPAPLVPFREVERRLALAHMVDRGVREVELGAVVGSLNRTRDFDRAFLPRDDTRREEVRAMSRQVAAAGYPPVELYQVGRAYFVVDGHHRIAAARSLGAETIEAQVREFVTDVDVEPGDDLDAMLAKAAARNFEHATGLPTRGEGALVTSSPAGHDRLLEHIAAHRYYLGTMYDRPFGWEEAVASWRDTVYRPVVQVIRERRLLADFPGRTETDLYLWVIDRLHFLRQEYGDHALGPDAAVPATTRWQRWWRRLRRLLGG